MQPVANGQWQWQMANSRHAPIFLFEKGEVCWSGGMNMHWISRDVHVQLCVQKVAPWFNREWLAPVANPKEAANPKEISNSR
jgi:hypothetical protein